MTIIDLPRVIVPNEFTLPSGARINDLTYLNIADMETERVDQKIVEYITLNKIRVLFPSEIEWNKETLVTISESLEDMIEIEIISNRGQSNWTVHLNRISKLPSIQAPKPAIWPASSAVKTAESTCRKEVRLYEAKAAF